MTCLVFEKIFVKMISRNKRLFHFQLMRELGRELEFEPNGDAICTDAPGERKTILYTLTKEL